MRDKQFFLVALALENATQQQLDKFVNDTNKIIKKNTRGGKISDPARLTSQMNKLIDSFYGVFVDHLQVSVERVGKMRAQEALDETMPKLREAGLFTEAISFYNQIKSYEQDVANRFMFHKYAGVTMTFRIKTLNQGTQKTVGNIIANGVEKGNSARVIAKRIEQYVNPLPGQPRVAPYDEYRERFGRAKSFTPKGVPAGSVQYNAMRIARTETARVYRESTVAFYDKRDWCKGFKWVLSNSHPRPDICDSYASVEVYEANDIPTPHPHCLCDIQAIIMTPKEMKELRLNYGEIGNPFRDTAGRFSNEREGVRI